MMNDRKLIESKREVKGKSGKEVRRFFSKKILRFWPILAVLAIFITACAGYGFWSMEQDRKADSGSNTVEIALGDIRISALGSGILIPADEISFGFENGGVVDQVLVEVGDVVQTGDTLAILVDDDLVENLEKAEAEYKELTSPVMIAAASLDVVQAERAVMNAEGELEFLISPYLFKSEIRLQKAQAALQDAIQNQQENNTQEAGEAVAAAQQKVDLAALSVEMNRDTYFEEYVPDFFNFPWRDRFGYWHDYFDPPSDTEVDVAWAALDEAKARLEAGKMYLAALKDGAVPDDAYGSEIANLEVVLESLNEARRDLASAVLTAPMDGVITSLNLSATESVDSSAVVTIARLDPPTLEGYFDEGDWSLVVKGNPVEVVFDAFPSKTYQGEITFVDPALKSQGSSTSVYATVELDTTNTGWSDLPLGSSASLEIIADQVQNAVLVPLDALQEDTGDTGTVIVQENGEYITKEIELGLRNVLYGEVLSGLSEGDLVVLGYSR